MYHTWSKHRGEVLEIAKVERKKLEETLHFFTKLKKTRQTRLLAKFFIFNASFDRHISS